MSSPYPRRRCPKCQHVVQQDDHRCPNCGFDFRPGRKPLSWWVVAEIVVIAYPVLVYGSCLVMESVNPSNMGMFQFKTINLIVAYGLPLLIVGVFVWTELRKRTR